MSIAKIPCRAGLLVLGATALVALGSCQTASIRDSDRLTWRKGLVSLPASPCLHLRRMELPETEKECLIPGVPNAAGPIPAVLFLHGCSGFNGRQYHVMSLFIDNGYAVFAPDSFARPGRYRACGATRRVLQLRMAEIDYALARIRALPWVDQSRLVLAGFSSGGLAAAEHHGAGFKARVILGWGCGNGIAASSDIPVLNLVGQNDHETRHGAALCSVTGRKNSIARHVDAGHDVANDPAARTVVKEFLDKVL
jgi:dienelactone hydrolase